jgi:hypothetical protein
MTIGLFSTELLLLESLPICKIKEVQCINRSSRRSGWIHKQIPPNIVQGPPRPPDYAW